MAHLSLKASLTLQPMTVAIFLEIAGKTESTKLLLHTEMNLELSLFFSIQFCNKNFVKLQD